MTDVKDRFYKARRKAIANLTRGGFRVVILHDEVFDIEASDDDIIKKIKICIDAVPRNVPGQIAQVALPISCRRQIWLKRFKSSDFEIIKIKPRQ